MSDTSYGEARPPLGVGSIISESFSIFFRNFVAVVLLAFVPTLIGALISYALLGRELLLGVSDPDFTDSGVIVAYLLTIVISLAIYGVTVALLVQLAYDVKTGRRATIGRYVGPAMAAAVPIGILGLVAGILTGIAAIALIIPGLWVYAVFSVMPPAVVIDKVGFGGLGRSASLTKDYRWPILGAIILIGIINAALGFAGGFVNGLLLTQTGFGGSGLLVYIVIDAFFNAIFAGLGGIVIALIYARLREIKEGVSVSDLVAVFN